MATNFPTNLDALTNPSPTDTMVVISHSSQHTNANDAIEAIQTKIGINNSDVTGTLDYRVNQLEGETGNGTFKTFNGKAYLKYTGIWHEIVPVLDGELLTFEISTTGVLR